jgi:hypothetical protein
MTNSAQPTAHARDGALRRLRGLTIGVAGTALGAVAVFAAIGAATIPGHSTTTSQGGTTSTSSSTTSSQTDTGSSLQTSPAPQAASSSGSSHAATGGS